MYNPDHASLLSLPLIAKAIVTLPLAAATPHLYWMWPICHRLDSGNSDKIWHPDLGATPCAADVRRGSPRLGPRSAPATPPLSRFAKKGVIHLAIELVHVQCGSEPVQRLASYGPNTAPSRIAIERHRGRSSYVEEGVRLLELARNAQRLFEKQEPREKCRLLNFVVSNCTWKRGELVANLRQPFDLLALTTARRRTCGG